MSVNFAVFQRASDLENDPARTPRPGGFALGLGGSIIWFICKHDHIVIPFPVSEI